MARKKRKQAVAKPQRKPTPKGIGSRIIQQAVRGYNNQERHSQLSEAAKLALDERIKEIAADSDMLWPPDEHKERGTPDIVKQMDKIVGISPEDRELINSRMHGLDSKAQIFEPGTHRDLTVAKELMGSQPIGSKFYDKDGREYEVVRESFDQGGRFLDWILHMGERALVELAHLRKHPERPIRAAGYDGTVIEMPFNQLTEEDRSTFYKRHMWWTTLGRTMQEPGRYKRLLLDANQATQFAEMPTGPDKTMQQILHPPFPAFYLEFTEPIVVGEPETNADGANRDDEILALVYDEHAVRRLENAEFNAGLLTLFLRENNTQEISYRSFVVELESGRAVTSVEEATDHWNDPSIVPPGSNKIVDIHGRLLLYALRHNSTKESGRYAGYWERTIAKYAEFFSWLILYTVAKGIEIVEEPLPRSERRRMARAGRKGELPEPWQIVRVEPTVVRKYESRQAGSPEKATHGYRYDVRGHLRKGKHKLRDGSYKYTVEWVPAHQRGLKHELYIPKIHQYSGEMVDKFIPEEEYATTTS